MSDQFLDLFAALAAPFAPHEVKTRQQGGRNLSYITARTAMNRLDEILGPSNWWDEYVPSDHSVLCKLTIRLPDGSTVTKADAGGMAGMSDQGDDEKSGYSDAFKRAAVKFGVSRYLYRDGVPEFVRERVGGFDSQPSHQTAPPPQRSYQQDYPPPQRPQGPQPQQRPQQSQPQQRDGQWDRPPGSGRALFAWIKDMGTQHGVGLLDYMNKWGKLQDFPGRIVDWQGEQVTLAHREAVRKLSGAPDEAPQRPPARPAQQAPQFDEFDQGEPAYSGGGGQQNDDELPF